MDELQQKNEELETRLIVLERFIASLSHQATVPVDVGLALSSLTAQTSKLSTSESIAVNSATATPVLKEPDGFDYRIENGTTKYYPFFT